MKIEKTKEISQIFKIFGIRGFYFPIIMIIIKREINDEEINNFIKKLIKTKYST